MLVQMKKLFNNHVDVTLEFKQKKCEEPVPIPELNSVQSLCKLIEVLCIPENGVEFTGDVDMFSNICRLWFIFWYIILYYIRKAPPRMKRIIISLLLLVYEKKEAQVFFS